MKKGWNWDKDQREVIGAPVNKRILVDAGPGTGKTAVACGRVAWLINDGAVNASDIWLISFTRTAVQEIRNRIKSFLDDEGVAYSVKVATLDSHAWKIHSGFDSGAELLGTYDDNIEKLVDMIKNDSDGEITEYLKTVQHLIVDEAQDIVGIRAELVLEIIDKLSDHCGVTIFSDEAQAIYGFSLDEDAIIEGEIQKTLSEKVRKKFGSQFFTCELKNVFRTQSHNLNELFTATRHKIMEPSNNPLRKLHEIRKEISKLADERDILQIKTKHQTYPENSFILYRKRAEVLMAASYLGETPHRIRMSGLPQCIYPWVGACLSEHTKGNLSREEFIGYWNLKVKGNALENGFDWESAWEQLVQLAGKTRTVVDMKLLRQRLGQGKPPAEFCSPEIGTHGPIIGTIHASKGRETDNIYLMMPPEPDNNEDGYENANYEEETKVMFVGATRARKYLGVGKGYNYHFSSRVESSGRVFAKKGSMNAMVEIGRDGDINATGMAGQNYYENADIVHKHQEKLFSFADKIALASATMDRDCEYVYRLTPKYEDGDIAVLSKQALTGDLFEVGKRTGTNKRPPDRLHHLRIYGIRTIVLPPDSPECNNLHEPWAKSGIMLAPVILGYTKAFFPYYKIRR